MEKLYLVSCVKVKQERPAPARELYQSLWFRSARAFVEKQNAEWKILSALYGLVEPEQILKPYEVTLNKMAMDDRRFWARMTAQQIARQIEPRHVTFLAGKNYRELLIAPLEELGFTWDAPLARLGIGQQVSWLQKHAREEKA